MELLILFATLQAVDAYTTHRFLTDKTGVEMNPIMRKLFEQFDHIPVFIVTKSLLIYAAYATMGHPYWNYVIGALCLFYAIIVTNNLRLIK